MAESDDPTVIRSIAVTTDDVVTALEARRAGRPVVLRVTPPFSGRMRARLHVAREEYDDTPAPIHVDPGALLDAAAPAHPEPGETEDAIRADPDLAYSTELHHERHVAAVEAWRERVCEHVADAVRLETPAGPHRVEVIALG